MISLIRKNQQVLMILVTVLVIIAFVWLYNGVRWEKMGESEVAEAFGQPVKQLEIEQRARKLNLASDLGLMEFAQILAGVGPQNQQGPENFIWNLMVVERHADALQIEPDDAAVLAQIKELPAFQTDGQFDPQKYALFADSRLSPRGFTEKNLQEVVRDQLGFDALKRLVGSTVAVAPGQVREMFDRENTTVLTEVARLAKASVEPEVTVTDEDVAQAFEQQKDSLKSPEKRTLTAAKFVRAEKPPADEDPRDQVRAVQAVADKAEGFGVKAVGEGIDFRAAATEMGAEILEVPAFPQSNPPALLGSDATLAQAAFSLTNDQPVSGVQQVGADTFYVLKLEQVEESKPLTFEQAKEEVRTKLREQRVAERLNIKAGEARQAIAKELEAGKTFADAAKSAGLIAEEFPGFSMAKPQFEAPDAPAVMQTAMTMKEGTLSEPVPTQSGILLVHVKQRQLAPEAEFTQGQKALEDTLIQNTQLLAFVEWLRQEREAAEIRILTP